jgi:putative endonuclease
METGSGERIKWTLKPAQLLWKLSDRARQHRQAHVLNSAAALGKRGEDLAHRYLQRAGFQVVARNYKPGDDSEVDIVARRGELLVFVEVKTRNSDEHSAPERNIDVEKERHILRAAKAFATRAGIEWDKVRFDVISIVMNNPPTLAHYQDAFYG